MRGAYVRLHELGWAHSIEVWDAGGALAGGLYGVELGGLFAAESMFHVATDASKVALGALVGRLAAAGGARVLDVQWTTPHLRTLGARDVARGDFLARAAGGAQRAAGVRPGARRRRAPRSGAGAASRARSRAAGSATCPRRAA